MFHNCVCLRMLLNVGAAQIWWHHDDGVPSHNQKLGALTHRVNAAVEATFAMLSIV